MQVATILPMNYLKYTKSDNYHLCLAHLLSDDRYMKFFRSKSRRGDLVMMDNGVVETGLAMDMPILIELASVVEATEVILPDSLNNTKETLRKGLKAIDEWEEGSFDLIAVPQGNTFEEWRSCMECMLEWPVATIGISKFTAKFSKSRLDLLRHAELLIESHKDIHLLGCISISNEICQIEEAFPGRVRGIDSGIAAIAAQECISMESIALGERVDKPLDFFGSSIPEKALVKNINFWKEMCERGIG